MKKLIVALFAAILMTSGLVAFSGTTATAACPYEGCLNTTTTGAATVARSGSKTKVTVRAKVRAVDSNKRPVGKVKFTVKRKGTSKVLVTQTKTLSSGNATFSTRVLKRGSYQFALQYKRAADSGFRNSVGKGTFKIRK